MLNFWLLWSVDVVTSVRIWSHTVHGSHVSKCLRLTTSYVGQIHKHISCLHDCVSNVIVLMADEWLFLAAVWQTAGRESAPEMDWIKNTCTYYDQPAANDSNYAPIWSLNGCDLAWCFHERIFNGKTLRQDRDGWFRLGVKIEPRKRARTRAKCQRSECLCEICMTRYKTLFKIIFVFQNVCHAIASREFLQCRSAKRVSFHLLKICVCVSGCFCWRMILCGLNRKQIFWVRAAVVPSSTEPHTEVIRWPSNAFTSRNASSSRSTVAQVHFHWFCSMSDTEMSDVSG